MRFFHLPTSLLPFVLFGNNVYVASETPSVDLSWHSPLSSDINNSSLAINGTGTYGFIFNSSTLPADVPYGTYNWCNMPHVRPSEYPLVNSSFSLSYVEVIHRHHKRTPYAANTFPHEYSSWDCKDEGLFYYGSPLTSSPSNHSTPSYWSVYTSPSNPLTPSGFPGTCQFPQITRGGLDDSHQHGLDIYAVYHTLLDFLPSTYNPSLVSFRVTNNVITSQVAGMLLSAMYPSITHSEIPLLVQPASIDSLEPAYACPAAVAFRNSFFTSPPWSTHLSASAPLFATLDAISGIDPVDPSWHRSWDHYFDNLSSRLCASKPLPCGDSSTTSCITDAQAATVFRLGEWEYSRVYRDDATSLRASAAAYGIWIAELAQNLRHVVYGGHGNHSSVPGQEGVKYRHNVAHDGSVARVLSVLQVEEMVWPGMGAEIVFEVWKRERDGEMFVRVLWGGQVLTSSNPSLGYMDMVPVGVVLAYFDGLVGVGARLVPGLCGRS